MALIASTSLNQVGAFTATKTVLTAADTLTYTPNDNQILVMYNITAAPVIVTIDGADGTTVVVPGAGGSTFSVAAGLAVTVPADGYQVVRLDTIPAYLKGVVAVTGGVGVVATILK